MIGSFWVCVACWSIVDISSIGVVAASTDSFVESLETSVVITSSDAFPFDVVMIFVDMLASIIVDVCPPYVVMDLVDIPAIKVVKDCAGVKVAVVAKLFADVSPART